MAKLSGWLRHCLERSYHLSIFVSERFDEVSVSLFKLKVLAVMPMWCFMPYVLLLVTVALYTTLCPYSSIFPGVGGICLCIMSHH